MSKSIYEEALKHLNILNNFVIVWCDEIDLDYHDTYKNNYQKVIKALEQAKKQEELLERLYNVCKEYKHMSIGLSDDSDFINIMNDIEELENE